MVSGNMLIPFFKTCHLCAFIADGPNFAATFEPGATVSCSLFIQRGVKIKNLQGRGGGGGRSD